MHDLWRYGVALGLLLGLSGCLYDETKDHQDWNANGGGAPCEGSQCPCASNEVRDPGTGECVVPTSPCDPSPCGAGAACRIVGSNAHLCQCELTDFVKANGETQTCDAVSPDVCIARGDALSLYNSVVEDNAAGAEVICLIGVSPTNPPTLTEWAAKPCAEAAAEDFSGFLGADYAQCGAIDDIVGVPSCLHLTDGTDAFWDILFTDWCVDDGSLEGVPEPGGCFSYERFKAVADGQACP